MLYLDTSVLISALTREPRTAASQLWLSQQDAGQLAISDWVVTEYSSALSIKSRAGQLAPDLCAAALAQFTQMAVNTFAILPIGAAAFRTAARFCDQTQLKLRAGDALHIAICAEHGATVCTLDQRLGEAAPHLGVASILL